MATRSFWSAQRLAAILGPVLVVLVLGALAAQISRRALASQESVRRAGRVTLLLEQTLGRSIDAETATRGFLLTNDPDFLEPYRGAREAVDRDLELLRSLVTHPRQGEQLGELERRTDRTFRVLRDQVQLRRSGVFAPDSIAGSLLRGKAAMDSVRATVADLQSEQRRVVVAREAATAREARLLAATVAGGILLAVVLALLTNLLLAREAREQHRAAERLEQNNLTLQRQAEEMEAQAEALQSQAALLQENAAELEMANDELARAGNAAERERERLAAVQQATPDGFMIFDSVRNDARQIEDFRWVYLNPAAERMVGRSADDLVGERLLQESPGVRDQGLFDAYRGVVETGNVWQHELRYRREGVDAWFRITAAKAGDGFAVSFADVSESKRAELESQLVARASEALAAWMDPLASLTALTETVVPELADWCAVDLVEEDGSIRRAAVAHPDPERKALAEEMVRRYPTHPDEPRGVAAVIRSGESEMAPEVPPALLEAGARDPEHLRMLRSLELGSYLIVPLQAEERRVGALTLVQSASGRRFTPADVVLAQELARRAAEALERARLYAAERTARAEAEEANRAKSEFLAAMSHELRTPLNAIAGYTDLIELGIHGPVTPEQKHALERIDRNQEHLLGLINDILNFAKIEAGRLEFEREDIVLREVLLEMEALIEPQLRAAELDYEVQLPRDASRVVGDRDKVDQIVLNLLSNATKFTAPGGRVTLAAGTEQGRGYVRVSDTGRGIPPEMAARIFDPFVQVDRRRTESSQQGVGLGLAISRELARGMGGDLSVQSEEERGSVFTLVLPLAIAPS